MRRGKHQADEQQALDSGQQPPRAGDQPLRQRQLQGDRAEDRELRRPERVAHVEAPALVQHGADGAAGPVPVMGGVEGHGGSRRLYPGM